MSPYAGTEPRPYGGKGRPRNPKLDKRILDGAIRELIDKGFGGVTNHSVAKRAGVGRSAIARRFMNTVDMVSDAILCQTSVQSVEKSKSLFNDLYEMIENSAESAARGDMPRVLAAAFMEESRHPELITMYRKAVGWPRRQMVRDALRNGVQKNLVRRDIDLDVAVDLIVGAAMERRYAGLYFGDKFSAEALDIVLHGILRPEVGPDFRLHYGE